MSSQRGYREMVFSPTRLNEEIDRRVLSHIEAAHLIRVPEKSLSRWRKGEVHPRRAAVRRMAEAFECDPLDLMVEPDDIAA